MKRRVGKYKNKIIVEGDKNEFKPHEVSIKELAGTDNMGGSGDSNGITYYKVNLDNVDDGNYHHMKLLACMVATEMKAIYGEAGQGFSYFSIGPAGGCIYNADGNFKPLAIGVPSYIKIVIGRLDDNDNFTDKDIMILEGTLKEVIDTLSGLESLPFNYFDYLEPITKEEFYNISG